MPKSDSDDAAQQQTAAPSAGAAGPEPGPEPAQAVTNKEARLARKAARAAAKAAQEAKPVKQDLRGATMKRKRTHEASHEAESVQDAPTAGERVEGSTSAEQGDQPAETQEEEPLSHKEMRKRRKLAKAADRRGDSSQPPAPTTRKVEHTKEKDTRSPYALWVGNMSFKTTSENLVAWLEDKGIAGISRVAMPKGIRKGEKNRGYAYVDVPSQNEVEIGIRMSELPLDGRKLLIKSGGDFSGRPGIPTEAVQAGTKALTQEQKERHPGLPKTAAAILRKQKHPPAETLFFGNLSFKTTPEDIRIMLTRAADARMSRGEKQAAQEGRDKKHTEIKKESEGKNQGESGDHATHSDTDSDSDSDSDQDSDSESGSDSDSDSDSDSNSNSNSKPSHEQTSSKFNKRGAKGQKESGQIRGAGIRKIRMGTFEDAPEKCKGWSFVDFQTLEHATAALIDFPAAHRLLGRQLEVAYASPDAVRRGAKRTTQTTDGQRAKSVRPSKSARLQKRAEGTAQRVWGASGSGAAADGGAPDGSEGDRAEIGPGTFDPSAPLPKAHKPTQAERAALRAAAKKGSSGRAPPGAALAQAQRAPVAAAPAGTRTTFD